jgi:hypothetical protein
VAQVEGVGDQVDGLVGIQPDLHTKLCRGEFGDLGGAVAAILLVLIQLFKIDLHDQILPSGIDTIAALFESVDNASNHFPLVDNEIAVTLGCRRRWLENDHG